MYGSPSGARMRVAVILPRAMDFSVDRATSIDLSAHDLVLHSRFRNGTVVIGESSGEPLPGVEFLSLQAGTTRDRLAAIAALVRRERSEAVVVHQHLPTAAALAHALGPIPVLLHRHNYEKLSSNPLRAWWKRRRLASVSQLSFVSEAARQHFNAIWPMGPRAAVVPNGLDMTMWHPADKTRREIIIVGRAVSAKGILPAALGVERALQALPNWQASFVLGGTREEPDYFNEVAQIISRSPRTRLLVEQPFSVVKELTEAADIAIVPSVWNEPFGRTALEALAGGAALITSGRGGLAEVAGDAAEYLAEVEGEAIAASLQKLAGADDARRSLQSRGRARAERLFDIRACAARLDSLVEAATTRAA